MSLTAKERLVELETRLTQLRDAIPSADTSIAEARQKLRNAESNKRSLVGEIDRINSEWDRIYQQHEQEMIKLALKEKTDQIKAGDYVEAFFFDGFTPQRVRGTVHTNTTRDVDGSLVTSLQVSGWTLVQNNGQPGHVLRQIVHHNETDPAVS